MINQITEVLARGVGLKNAACFIVKNVLNTKQNRTLENRNEGVCYQKNPEVSKEFPRNVFTLRTEKAEIQNFTE